MTDKLHISRFFAGLIASLAVLIFILTSSDLALAATGGLEVHQEIGTTPTGSDGGSSSGSVPRNRIPQFLDVKVSTSYNSTTLDFKTSELTVANVKWGKSNDYADGIISLTQFSKSHLALITDLNESAHYYFLITITNQAGNQITYAGEFITVSAPDTKPPGNVSKFIALPYQDSVGLSWRNPIDPDFDFVRIVKSTKFYPLDPFNGQVIFEGHTQSFIDEDVVPGTIYYYSAFARDKAGNYSPGSLSSAMIAWYSENPLPPGPVPDPVVDLDPVPADELPSKLLTRDNFSYYYFDSNNNRIDLNSRNLIIPESAELHISIPKTDVYDEAETLTVSVHDPTKNNADTTYLFTFNSKTGVLETKLPRFENSGEYSLEIEVFNFEKKRVQSIYVPLGVKNTDFTVKFNEENNTKLEHRIIVILFITIILIVLWFVYKKPRQKH